MNYSLGNMLSRGGALNPDGLSLDLAFALDKTLTARKGPTPTFTRGSTGTFVGSNGLIQSAAINTPRFDHNPTTLASLGLLIEESRINLLNGSQTFATSGGIQNNWVDTNITRDGTLRTSPDGTSNALRITASAANGTVISSAAAGSSAARVFSIFLRRVTGTGNIQYTLDNGSTWTTQAITSSWVRYTFAATTANQQVGIRIVTSGDAIEIWGAQLEAGSFPTSYIPTTTTALTRSADVCSIANTSSFWNSAEFTLFTNANWVASGFDSYSSNFNITAGFFGARRTSTNQAVAIIRSSGVNADINFGSFTTGSMRMAIAHITGQQAASLNGASAVQYNSVFVPSSNPPFNIGGSGSGAYINGHIARIQYFRKRLPNAKLQSLTT